MFDVDCERRDNNTVGDGVLICLLIAVWFACGSMIWMIWTRGELRIEMKPSYSRQDTMVFLFWNPNPNIDKTKDKP